MSLERKKSRIRLWAIAHKYFILPLCWKSSIITKIPWFPLTYLFPWAGGGCPARFWIIFTLIMFSAIQRRLINFQKIGWHSDTCHENADAILQHGCSFLEFCQMPYGTYSLNLMQTNEVEVQHFCSTGQWRFLQSGPIGHPFRPDKCLLREFLKTRNDVIRWHKDNSTEHVGM